MFGRRASEHEAVYAKLVPQLEPLEAIAAKSLASSLSLSLLTALWYVFWAMLNDNDATRSGGSNNNNS